MNKPARSSLLCLLAILVALTTIFVLRKTPQTSSRAASAETVISAAPAQTSSEPAPAEEPKQKHKHPVANLAQAAPTDLSQAPGASTGRPWDDIAGWDGMTPRQRLIKLFAAPFGIMDRGRVQMLEVAKDELFDRHRDRSSQQHIAIAPQPDAEALLREADAVTLRTGRVPQFVLYPVGQKHTLNNMRVLSEQVLMKSDRASEVVAAANGAGLQDTAPMAAAPGYVLGNDNRYPGAALIAAADLSKHHDVAEARPMLAVHREKKFTPNDPLFTSQWHLKQSGSTHVNVSGVWDTNKGAGVTVAVVDDGLQTTHPDLQPNVSTAVPTLHHDYVGDDDDPTPVGVLDNPSTTDVIESEDGDNHGTSCAGLLAARGNNGTGGSGVAPEATLVGIRLLSATQTPADEAAAFGLHNDVIQAKSNSWGPPDGYPWILGTADPVVQSAMANAASTGRGSLGTVLMFAAGNGRQEGDQANKDAYANNIHTCAIGALTKSGGAAVYSEYGANLIACAPADGVTTTDLMGNYGYNPSYDYSPVSNKDYTDEFNGTSAACPVAAGVVALMLKANPNLGWRDVKEILLRSSTKIASTDTEWVSRTGGKPSLPVIKHNPKYGGGMVNAAAATAMAAAWTNLGTMNTLSSSVSGDTAIPDNSATGITKTLDFSSQTPMRVEQVEVEVDISHEYRGDLLIQLVSPAGVVSNLATVSGADGGEEVWDPIFDDALDPALRGYHGWVFTSSRHWGESSRGAWKLQIADRSLDDVGTLHSATIRLHGVAAPPVQITPLSAAEQLAVVGHPASIQVSATGYADIIYAWKKNGTTVTGAAATYALTSTTTSSVGIYSVTASNVTGTQSATFKVGVIVPPPASSTFNVGTTITLNAPATVPTGSTATYQWQKGGVNVVDDPIGLPTSRIKGATTKTLTILKAQSGDEGNYECIVTMGTAMQGSGVAAVSIRYKPDIQLNDFPTDLIVSGAFTPINLNIANGTTKVTISGLPSGMTYNTLTGIISGTPNVPVTSVPITITAYNLAGYTQKKINLTVAALDPETVGTFDGNVSRTVTVPASSGTTGAFTSPANFGGCVSNLVVTSTGSFTGRLYIAGHSYVSFSGRLAASASADPTASILVPATSPTAKLRLAFAIDRTDGHLYNATLSDGVTWDTTFTGIRRAPAPTIGARQNFFMDATTKNSSATEPNGASAGYAVVSTTGAVTATIKMADGLSITKSTSRGPAGDVPVFAMMYANKGSVLGSLIITDQVAPLYDTVGGSFTWNKTGPSSTSDKTYAGGFDFGVHNANTLTVLGSEYRKPATGTILWGLPVVLSPNVNAQLDFSSANVESSAYGVLDAANITPSAVNPLIIDKTFRISTSHVVSMPLPNTAVVTCSVSSTTGEISGKLTLKDGTPVATRTLTYYSVVAPGIARGHGWFTLPQLPATTVQSGAVEFKSVP